MRKPYPTRQGQFFQFFLKGHVWKEIYDHKKRPVLLKAKYWLPNNSVSPTKDGCYYR